MKKRFIALLVVLVSVFSTVSAQKFYVEKTDNGYEQPIIDKLILENYKITFKQDSANYTIKCIIGKTGMGRAKGSVALINNKSGDLIGKTKEINGQTAITNGYANPKMIAMKKIADKYLVKLIKEKVKTEQVE